MTLRAVKETKPTINETLRILRMRTICRAYRGNQQNKKTNRAASRLTKEILSRVDALPVDFEPATKATARVYAPSIAIDRTRREGGKEKKVGEEFRHRQRCDQPVLNAEEDIQGPEGDIRNPEKAKFSAGRDKWQKLGRY